MTRLALTKLPESLHAQCRHFQQFQTRHPFGLSAFDEIVTLNHNQRPLCQRPSGIFDFLTWILPCKHLIGCSRDLAQQPGVRWSRQAWRVEPTVAAIVVC